MLQLRILAFLACSKVARRVSIRKAECGTYLLVFGRNSQKSRILRIHVDKLTYLVALLLVAQTGIAKPGCELD